MRENWNNIFGILNSNLKKFKSYSLEDDDEADPYDPVWHDQQTEKRMVFQFDAHISEVGLRGRAKSTDPIFYLDAVLGNRNDFFNLLSSSCNIRAQEILQRESVGPMYLKQITAKEMQVFLALCLEMSNLKMPHLSDYWNETGICGFHGFNSHMTLNRFQLLLRVFNLREFSSVANAKQSKEPLVDIENMIEFFNQQMANIYCFGPRLVLDEPIIFWKRRMHWFRNLNQKFRSNALLLHVLSENTGLILRLKPEKVCKMNKDVIQQNSRSLVTEHIEIAKDLLQGNLNNGRTLYVSKYYGSFGLTYELARYGTYCTGFLDQRRYGNCKQLVLRPLEGYFHAAKYAGAVLMGKWRRKEKNVYFNSSDCLAISEKENSTRRNDRRIKIIKELDWQLNKPKQVREDLISYQLTLTENQMKWDRIVMIHILNLMVSNAYILYTIYAQFGRARIKELHLKDTTKLKTYAQFREYIIQSLLNIKDLNEEGNKANEQGGCKKKKLIKVLGEVDKNAEEKDCIITTYKHEPKLIPQKNERNMKKRCRVCHKGGLMTLTKYYCPSCVGVPGLCESPCFKIWHKK